MADATDTTTSAVVPLAAGETDGRSSGAGGNRPGGKDHKPGIWARAQALWHRLLDAIGGWPKWLRWLLTLAGAALTALAGTLGFSNAGTGAKVLFAQGPGAFWKYVQQQPFGRFAIQFPVAFVIVVLVGFAIIRLAAIIRKQNQVGEGVDIARRGTLEALSQKERIKDSELPAKLKGYLDQLCKRYDKLELPSFELRLSEVAIDLPMRRRMMVGVGASRVASDKSSAETPSQGATGSELSSRLFDSLRTRIIPADSIEQIPSRVRRFVIVGGPDSGKSTLLKFKAIAAARSWLDTTQKGQQAEGPLPVYLSAPDILAAGAVTACIREMLERFDANIVDVRLAHNLTQAIRAGKAIVCIDDLDSVEPARRPLVAESIAQMEAGDETTILVATRTKESQGGTLLRARFREWELQDLAAASTGNASQGGTAPLQLQLAKKLFAAFDRVLMPPDARTEADSTATRKAAAEAAAKEAQAFIEALNADPRSANWRSNPLLFSVAATMQAKEGHLPPNRVEMYRRLLAETQHRGGVSDEIAIGQRLSRRVLADLALWLSEHDRRTLSLDDLLTFLVEVERETPLGASQLGERLVHESVLEGVGGGRLSFRYDAFVEYLAAVALAQGIASGDGSRPDALRKFLDTYPLAGWHDVLVLVPSVLVQEYGRAGGRAALGLLRTLLGQAETPSGDPAAMGIELALDALDALGELPPSWSERGLASDIGAAWVAELRRAALYGQATRQRYLLALAPRLARIGGQAQETAAGADVGQAAALQVQAVFGDPDPCVRETMAQAMLVLREHVRIQEIVKILQEDAQREARTTAIRVLWDLPAETAERSEALRAALGDEYWPVRFLALTGLAGKPPMEDISRAEITRALGDPAPAVQLAAQAYSALKGRTGPDSWMGTLLRAQWGRVGLDFAEERVTLRTCAAAIGLESFGVLAERQFGDIQAAFRRSARAAENEAKALAAPRPAPAEDGATPQAGETGDANGGEAATAEESREQARQAAVHALRSLGILNDETLTALRRAVGDGNSYVRAGAGLGLGLLAVLEAIQSVQAGDPAASLRDDSVLVRVAALIWLALVEDDPTAILRAQLDQNSPPAVRFVAVLLLGVIAADEEADAILLKDLLVEKTRDPSFAVAAAASLMLSAVVPPVSRDALVRGLNTSSPATRFLTLCVVGLLGALGKLDGPIQALDIENALKDEKRWELSLWAGIVTEWLRRQQHLSDKTALGLFAMPLRASEPAARAIAVMALCVLGFVGDQDERQLTSLLTGAVGDASPVVVASALAALAVLESFKKLSQPLAEGGLMPALRNANPLVRLIAIAALALLASSGRISTPALAEGLGRIAGRATGRDPSAMVRAAAVLALAVLGSEGSGKQRTRLLDQLSGALGDSSWWVRTSAAVGWVSADRAAPKHAIGAALGTQEHIWVRFGTAVLLAAEYDPRELRQLLLKLSAEGSKPSAVLAHSLRHLRRLGRHDPLLGALHNRSSQRRQRAAVMLAALDGMRVVFGERDEAVRAVAVLALGALSLIQLVERAPRGERHTLGLEGLLRTLLRSSAQEETVRDLSKEVRSATDSLRQNERIQRFLQQLRQSDQIAASDSQIAGLLRADTHWLIASVAALELGLFGALDVLDPANAQRVADALHDTRPHGQQWVRATALLVLYSSLLNGYEPQWREEEANAVWRDLQTWLDAERHTLWRHLSVLLPLRGLRETAHARAAWLRAAGVWLQGALAARSTTLRDQLSLPHLLALAADDASAVVRWAAVSVLRQLGESVDLAYLRQRLADPSALVRAAVVSALDARGRQVGVEVFEAALTDPDWSVRVEAVAALRQRQGVAGLQRALGDASPAVRVRAAAALTTEAQRAKGDPLLAAFGDVDAYLAALGVRARDDGVHEPAAGIVVAAAAALRELGQHVPPSWTAAAMDRGSDQSFQGIAAVQWLGISESLLGRLDEGLQSSSWRVRALTAAALGTLNDPRAADALRRCAEHDDDATVRGVAAGMLARRESGVTAGRSEGPLSVLLDILFVLGQDLQTAVTSWVRALTSGTGSAISRTLTPIAASLFNPTISADMLERLEALLDAASWSVRVRAAVALSQLQQAAPEPAVRHMLGLRRELGDQSDLDAEAIAWLVALDDALRLVLRPPAPATTTSQDDASA